VPAFAGQPQAELGAHCPYQLAAFARYLVEKPDQLPDHLLSRVAYKHVSLGLHPDQYKIVHEHLFWAIVDVLGEAVTPEVAAACDEVYWLMGNMLINQERGLYNAVHLSPETIWRTWGWPSASRRRTTS
jgi:nitric oxide dioxygenase